MSRTPYQQFMSDAVESGPPKDNGRVSAMKLDSAARDSGTDTGRLAVVSLAGVEPQQVQWLWPGRIPLGKLTLLAGVAGLGKSFLSLDLATRISNGLSWPDCIDDENPQGNVILLSAEDALADTVVPRLTWAKANLDRISAIEGVNLTDHSGQRSFDLQRDLLLLSDEIYRVGDVRLIVFDPLDSYLGQNVNANKGTDVRRVLGPLTELAENTGAAVIGVCHLNKSPALNALFRVCGSIAYGAIARAAWLIAEDPGDPGRRLFLKMKLNLAAAAPNLAFTIWNGMVLWSEGVIDMTADEVLGERRKDDDETPSKIGDAVEFLEKALAQGQQKVSDVQKWASEAGISKSTLKRAKIKLNVNHDAIWGGKHTVWYYSLNRVNQEPRDGTDGPDGPHGPHDRVDHVDQLDHQESIRESAVQVGEGGAT